MTSNTRTARNELQGRIELLTRQIADATEDAATARSEADRHDATAADLTRLRDEYSAILLAAMTARRTMA